MATKKPSAAQLAARKLFAERAKSGSFKNKSQKGRRAKAARMARAEKSTAVATRKKNPVRKPVAKKTVVKRNPVRGSVTRAAPKKSLAFPFHYQVDYQFSDGSWWPIAGFDKPDDAKAYARAYAKQHPDRTIRVFSR